MATEGGDVDEFMETEEQESTSIGEESSMESVMIIVSPWQQDINLTTKHGSSLWNEGTKPVDEKFTGQGRDVPCAKIHRPHQKPCEQVLSNKYRYDQWKKLAFRLRNYYIGGSQACKRCSKRCDPHVLARSATQDQGPDPLPFQLGILASLQDQHET